MKQPSWRKRVPAFDCALILLALSAGCSQEDVAPSTLPDSTAPKVDLSPADRPPGEWEEYLAMEEVRFPGNPLARRFHCSPENRLPALVSVG